MRFLAKQYQFVRFKITCKATSGCWFVSFFFAVINRCSVVCIMLLLFLLLFLFVNSSVTTTTTTTTNDENTDMFTDTKYSTAPCARCSNMTTTLKVNSSQGHSDAKPSSLSAGYHACSRLNVIEQ